MRLRRLETQDACNILEWMHDPDINKQFKITMQDLDINDVYKFIENANVSLSDGKTIHYAISEDYGEYLGTISLKNIDLVSKNAEYAISLRKKAQGRGVAYWATMELLNISFYVFQLERIYLNVLGDNNRAIKLYEKCGFKFEGEFIRHIFLGGHFRNLKWYAVLKSEFGDTMKGTEDSVNENHA